MIQLLLFNCDPLVSTIIHLLLSESTDTHLLPDVSVSSQPSDQEEDPQPDVIVICGDANLTLTEAIEQAHQRFADAKGIALVAENEWLPLYVIRDAALAGALQIAELKTVFVPLLRAIVGGATSFSLRIVTESIPQATGNTMQANMNDKLTEREQEILALLMTGYSNQQIAEALQLSEQTIRNYTSQVYAKFGVNSRAQLLARLNGTE